MQKLASWLLSCLLAVNVMMWRTPHESSTYRSSLPQTREYTVHKPENGVSQKPWLLAIHQNQSGLPFPLHHGSQITNEHRCLQSVQVKIEARTPLPPDGVTHFFRQWSVGWRISQNMNVFWNNPIQVSTACFIMVWLDILYYYSRAWTINSPEVGEPQLPFWYRYY